MEVYTEEQLLTESRKIIEENKHVYFIADVITYLPCGTTTFYERFPEGSKGSEEIKELLKDNKVMTKVKLRGKLADGEKTSDAIALMKLIGDDHEKRALSATYIDHTTGGKELNMPNIPDIGNRGGKV